MWLQLCWNHTCAWYYWCHRSAPFYTIVFFGFYCVWKCMCGSKHPVRCQQFSRFWQHPLDFWRWYWNFKWKQSLLHIYLCRYLHCHRWNNFWNRIKHLYRNHYNIWKPHCQPNRWYRCLRWRRYCFLWLWRPWIPNSWNAKPRQF